MHTAPPLMTDLAFSVAGNFLQAGHERPLWNALVTHLPWLEQSPHSGVIPLRGRENQDGIWLPRRTKLILRIPAARVSETLGLSGKTLAWDRTTLDIGPGSLRPLTPHPALHAHLVVSGEDEPGFLATVEKTLGALEIRAQWICGRRQVLDAYDPVISGYSLVLHHLSPEQSLQIQGLGLGEHRSLGCGLFVPYKVIPDLE